MKCCINILFVYTKQNYLTKLFITVKIHNIYILNCNYITVHIASNHAKRKRIKLIEY